MTKHMTMAEMRDLEQETLRRVREKLHQPAPPHETEGAKLEALRHVRELVQTMSLHRIANVLGDIDETLETICERLGRMEPR